MRHVRRVAILMVVMCLGLLAVSSPAFAAEQEDYLKKVGTALRISPLYVDDKASPGLSDSDQTRLGARLRSSGHPITVALVDNAILEYYYTPEDLSSALKSYVGSGMLVVSTSRGVTVSLNNMLSSGTERTLRDEIGEVTRKNAAKHSGAANLAEVLDQTVTLLSDELEKPAPTTRYNPPAPAPVQPADPPGLLDSPSFWVFAASAAALIGLLTLVGARRYRTREIRRQRKLEPGRVKIELEALKESLSGWTVVSEFDKLALSGLSVAKAGESLLAIGDVKGAAAKVEEARRIERMIIGDPDEAPAPAPSEARPEPAGVSAEEAETSEATDKPEA